MPEGDSVFVLARRLRSALDGHRLVDGETRSGAGAGSSLAGLTVVGHDTHGKHLLTRFDDGRSLHTHLRMQGSWTVTGVGKRLPRRLLPEVRVRMATAGGATAYGLDLPVVELLRTRDEREVIGHLGPDPLRSDWNADAAIRRLRVMGDRPAVAALLDQRGMSGLGNLWVNELCFLRGVWPWSPIASLDLPRLVALAARTLRHSATVAGAYQVTTGSARRDESHWVVGRAGRPCLRCRTTVLVDAGIPDDAERRRTWWCPRCQPEPSRPGARRLVTGAPPRGA
ncbi:MAG: hypothetical protein RI885_1862 [Actinomycetota bacterium]